MIDDTKLAGLLDFANRLADAADAVTLPHFRSSHQVQNKSGEGRFDPVTIADKDAERAIRDLILKHYPGHGVLGEEHDDVPSQNGFEWVIDPIDGTRAFIQGLPTWGTLIGLMFEGVPILGVMSQPFTGERYSGSRMGSQLQYNGRTDPITTRICSRLSDALMGTTAPELFNRPADLAGYLALSQAVTQVRFGGDCYFYASVALGCTDLVAEVDLNPFDIVALIPIIEGAGGVVTSWEGGSVAGGGRTLACGDPALHDAALELIASTQGD